MLKWLQGSPPLFDLNQFTGAIALSELIPR
jgi:hypothetical protein